MPDAVTALEDMIDKVTGTDKWIEGLPSAIELLEAEGADFTTIIGLELVDAAAKRGDLETLTKLKALGAPLSGDSGPSPINTAIFYKKNEAVAWFIKNGVVDPKKSFVNALSRSVSSDNHWAFRALLAVDSRSLLNKSLATHLLTKAAANADVEIVTLLLSKGADPNGPHDTLRHPSPPLFEASQGILSNDKNHSIDDRRKVVRILLDARAKISYCINGYCESPLWQVSDRQIAKMLIDAGADPNFRDDEGEHIFFNISNEQVALLLIEQGADKNAVRPADGKTLRGWAIYEKWPKVIEILDKAGL